MVKRNTYDAHEKRMLSLEEAAAYIGMGIKYTRRYMDDINATRKFGRRVAFDKKAIDAALDTLKQDGYNNSVIRSAQ